MQLRIKLISFIVQLSFILFMLGTNFCYFKNYSNQWQALKTINNYKGLFAILLLIHILPLDFAIKSQLKCVKEKCKNVLSSFVKKRMDRDLFTFFFVF